MIFKHAHTLHIYVFECMYLRIHGMFEAMVSSFPIRIFLSTAVPAYPADARARAGTRERTQTRRHNHTIAIQQSLSVMSKYLPATY